MLRQEATVSQANRSSDDSVEEIDVALGFDVAYAPHAATVIVSLVRNAPGGRFRFLLLHTGVPASTRDLIEATSLSSRFVWIEVRDQDLPAFANREWITRATLFRLGLEHLAPRNCHRVLYLDSDVVINGDIRALWTTDLRKYPIAAVTDINVDAAAFGARWKLDPPAPYFNAGVLLIDLDKVRREQSFLRTIEFFAKNNLELMYSDQDALNWAFWDNWLPLNPKWNVQRLSVIEANSKGSTTSGRLLKDAVVVHFTGSAKPWVAGSYHPWAWLYWSYLARTPFFYEARRASKISRGELWRVRLRWFRSRLKQQFAF